MPKAKTRRHKSKERTSTPRTQSTPGSHLVLSENTAGTTLPARSTQSRRATQLPGKRGSQSLLMSAMVALGCWGMAISFIFFTTDPNRYLYGGMAMVLALLWSFSLWNRLRKVAHNKNNA